MSVIHSILSRVLLLVGKMAHSRQMRHFQQQSTETTRLKLKEFAPLVERIGEIRIR